jgi:hypothetical protein
MLEHAIRVRAYELYAHRGMAEGHAVQDWLEAEAELRVEGLRAELLAELAAPTGVAAAVSIIAQTS